MNPSFSENLGYFFMIAWGTGYTYFLGRFSLIFPAIAVDFSNQLLGGLGQNQLAMDGVLQF